MTTNEVEMHVTTGELPLTDALAVAGAVLTGPSATVMWWSARTARWERLTDFTANGTSEVFEFRAFDGSSEVRWVRCGDTGTVAVLSDHPVGQLLAQLGDTSALQSHTPRSLVALPGTYVVWGEGSGQDKVVAGRIGTIGVPGVDGGGRYLLDTIEYVDTHPGSGTAYVCEERLVGLRPATTGHDSGGAAR